MRSQHVVRGQQQALFRLFRAAKRPGNFLLAQNTHTHRNSIHTVRLYIKCAHTHTHVHALTAPDNYSDLTSDERPARWSVYGQQAALRVYGNLMCVFNAGFFQILLSPPNATF